MKRGQGLPVSTIIVAALGILVLIVLSVIFSSWCNGRRYENDWLSKSVAKNRIEQFEGKRVPSKRSIWILSI